jgi:hypothetical protein
VQAAAVPYWWRKLEKRSGASLRFASKQKNRQGVFVEVGILRPAGSLEFTLLPRSRVLAC